MKPINHKGYGSIPHLPGSRTGKADHHCHIGQAKICIEKTRDRFDQIVIQEKVDGSCCCVYKADGQLHFITRSGNPAFKSKFEHHHHFAVWAQRNEERFQEMLEEGERACGEWLGLAHGTVYHYITEPFIIFDIMEGSERMTHAELVGRSHPYNFMMPSLLYKGSQAYPVATAYQAACNGNCLGSVDPVEGVVYRVERAGKVDFLAKWVHPDKVDGKYLPEMSGKDPIWMWRP